MFFDRTCPYYGIFDDIIINSLILFAKYDIIW